jgi:hypothetical protein
MHMEENMWEPEPLPLELIAGMSLSFAHALMVLAISNAIVRSPNTERHSRALVSKQWRSLHQHRFEAIRALNQELSDDRTRYSHDTFEGITLNLGIEVSDSTCCNTHVAMICKGGILDPGKTVVRFGADSDYDR